MTKEERFLVLLLEAGKDKAHDVVTIAAKAGVSPKMATTFVKTLIRTNFVRWEEYGRIKITPHGVSLANSLRTNLH